MELTQRWLELDMDKIETAGRRGNTTLATIMRIQHLGHPRHIPFTATDESQGANDISHHMVEECVCSHVKTDDVVVQTMNIKSGDISNRYRSLATSGPERGKIVFANEPGPGTLHRFHIQRPTYPPGAISQQGGTD